MNLMTTFNLRHAIISRSYYQRCVSFNIDPSLAGAPLPTPATSGRRSGEERSGRSPFTGKSSTVRAYRLQAQRRVLVEDCELTPQQLRKRYKNFRYLAKRQAKAQLILWPTKES